MRVALIKQDEDVSPFLSLEDLDRYVLGSPQSSDLIDRMLLSPRTPFSSGSKRTSFDVVNLTPPSSARTKVALLGEDVNKDPLPSSDKLVDVIDFLKSPMSVNISQKVELPAMASFEDDITQQQQQQQQQEQQHSSDEQQQQQAMSNNEFFQRIVNSLSPPNTTVNASTTLPMIDFAAIQEPVVVLGTQQANEQQEAMKSLISVMAMTQPYSTDMQQQQQFILDDGDFNEVKRTRSRSSQSVCNNNNNGIKKPSKMKKVFNLDNKIHNYSAEEFQQSLNASEACSASTASGNTSTTSKRTKKRNVKFFNNEFNQFVNGTHKTQQKPSKEKFKFTKMYW